MEKKIVEETQKKTKSKRMWDSQTFSGLMAYDPLEAAKFAVDCGVETSLYGVPVKEYIAKREAELESSKWTIEDNIKADEADKKAKADAKAAAAQKKAAQVAEHDAKLAANWGKISEEEPTTEVVEETATTVEPTTEETEELSADDLKELLRANNIKFHHQLGEAKLLKLAQENKLL